MAILSKRVVFAAISLVIFHGAGQSVTAQDSVVTGENQSSVPLEKIETKYTDFLGDHAESVVYGVKSGDEFTLYETTINPDGSETTTATTITPPTEQLGNGNVNIGLALAREELSQWDITQPTAEEIKAALVGGEIIAPSGGTVQLDGVLSLRSDGMGWGQIAQEYGVKLGHIVGNGNGYKKQYITTDPIQAGNTTGKYEQNRYRNKSAAQGRSQKNYGKGMVSAANESGQQMQHQTKATKQNKHT